jgi:hypothetical protein
MSGERPDALHVHMAVSQYLTRIVEHAAVHRLLIWHCAECRALSSPTGPDYADASASDLSHVRLRGTSHLHFERNITRRRREKLAEYLKGGQMDGAEWLALVVFIFVIVAVVAYRVGYLWAQVEFLNRRQMIEAKWTIRPMEAGMLPRWRRVAGWAASMCSALLLCLFLAHAYWHTYGWEWTYLMAVWAVWFAIFLGGDLARRAVLEA